MYAVDRVAIFATLALLIGGLVFLSVVFPAGRDSRRAQRIVWGGWIGAAVATIAGIALEGIYASALPLTKVFDPVSLRRRPRHAIRPRVARARSGCSCSPTHCSACCSRATLPRNTRCRNGGWRRRGSSPSASPSRRGWRATRASGEYTGLAIPADAIHVLAMACWLGGLVLLFAVVLSRTDPDELRQGIRRYSALALGSIVALVVTGGFQAWRQVGSFTALRDTDYGKLLIAKLVAFAALIVAAAFSREVVNRRFRMPRDDEPTRTTGNSKTTTRTPRRSTPQCPSPSVPACSRRGRPRPGEPALPIANGNGRSGGNGYRDDDDDDEWEEDDDETEVRRLRRSVFAEVGDRVRGARDHRAPRERGARAVDPDRDRSR